jgi:hypothetical protein
MARARQPVTINGVSFDALIDEAKTYEADVPAYPVEKGFEVSDAIILKPITLSMTLYLTNTPVTWRTRHGASPSRVQDVLKQLEAVYFSREPVTVVTSERTYPNMAIVSIELKKTLETGSSREIPIRLQEIRVTEAQTTSIPDSYRRPPPAPSADMPFPDMPPFPEMGHMGGTSGTNAGTASTTSSPAPAASGSGSRGSVLHGLASATGLLR